MVISMLSNNKNEKFVLTDLNTYCKDVAIQQFVLLIQDQMNNGAEY